MKRFLLALFAALLVACGGNGTDTSYTPAVPPNPSAVPRTDLFFAYYGDCGGALDCYPDIQHANMGFVPSWGYTDTEEERDAITARIVTNIAAMPKAIVAMEHVLFQFDRNIPFAQRKHYYVGDEEAKRRIRKFFDALAAENVLGKVAALYPMDEPEYNLAYPDSIFFVNQAIRDVMAERGLKIPLAVIYGGPRGRNGIESFDWVGVDDYNRHANILYEYDKLRGQLLSHQRLMLVPGGADPWRNDPKPFLDYAQQHQQVVGIVAFLWFTPPDNPDVGLGIGRNGMRKVYCEVGERVSRAGSERGCST